MLRRASDRQKKIIQKVLNALAAALLAVCLGAVGVMASEADRMPDLVPDQQGSLKLTMTYTDPNLETENIKTMANVTVKLAKVASLSAEGGSAQYTMLEPYSSLGIQPAGMTASESNEAAVQLAALATGSDVKSGTTGSDGTVTFTGLEPGMYLVFQDAGANGDYRVDAIAAMLLSVPYPVVSDAGNSWQYQVEAQPKTEMEGPKNNGMITVTKQLFDSETELAYNPPENTELVFYVGLFTDEACTQRAAGTSDQALRFFNSSTAQTVFENLVTDSTYYIAETDGNGNVVASVLKDEDILFAAAYPDGQAVSITRQNPQGTVSFRNETMGLPDGFYYGGKLTVTKKTVKEGGNYEMDDVFYAALFTDAAFRSRYGDVITLDMNGGSSSSVVLDVNIGNSEDDSATFYVTETDQTGRPLSNDGTHDFSISVNKDGGRVTLSPSSQEDEVVITNDFTEETTESETVWESETEWESETSSTTGTSRSGGSGGASGPRTGDETPIALYAACLAAAAVVLGAGAALGRRRRQK